MSGGTRSWEGPELEQVEGRLPSGFHMVEECVVSCEPPQMLSRGGEGWCRAHARSEPHGRGVACRPREPRLSRGGACFHTTPFWVWGAALLWPAGPAARLPGCQAGERCPEKWARGLGPRSTQSPPCCVRKGGGGWPACSLLWNLCRPTHIRCHPGVRPSYQGRGCAPSTEAHGHTDVCRSSCHFPP